MSARFILATCHALQLCMRIGGGTRILVVDEVSANIHYNRKCVYTHPYDVHICLLNCCKPFVHSG